jgi:hypothetical protein
MRISLIPSRHDVCKALQDVMNAWGQQGLWEDALFGSLR